MASISVRECQALSAPANGQISPDICKTKPLHGEVCFYKCNPGYTRTGPISNTTCDNGFWTHGGFHCQGKSLDYTVLIKVRYKTQQEMKENRIRAIVGCDCVAERQMSE